MGKTICHDGDAWSPIQSPQTDVWFYVALRCQEAQIEVIYVISKVVFSNPNVSVVWKHFHCIQNRLTPMSNCSRGPFYRLYSICIPKQKRLKYKDIYDVICLKKKVNMFSYVLWWPDVLILWGQHFFFENMFYWSYKNVNQLLKEY